MPQTALCATDYTEKRCYWTLIGPSDQVSESSDPLGSAPSLDLFCNFSVPQNRQKNPASFAEAGLSPSDKAFLHQPKNFSGSGFPASTYGIASFLIGLGETNSAANRIGLMARHGRFVWLRGPATSRIYS